MMRPEAARTEVRRIVMVMNIEILQTERRNMYVIAWNGM
jgi:hypothetical protein